MPRFLIAAAMLALFAADAYAQTPPPTNPASAAVFPYCWDSVTQAYAACGSGHTGGQATTTPPAVTGFGTLALGNTSTALSTLSLGPNSAAWPAQPGMVYVMNSTTSAGPIYVCPLGGTCTAANGIPIAVGQWYGFYRPASGMTAIAPSTATVEVQY
jgi:hypothetical protein